MSEELQAKLANMDKTNPLDEVVKTMLKSQAKCCVRAQVKLDELENKENDKKD